MDIPTPPQALAALAAFVRERLVEVSGTVAPLWRPRSDGADMVTTRRPDASVLAATRQFATVIVGAAAPFASTAYSRARLIRQLHASGLLSVDEASRACNAAVVLDLERIDDDGATGAPR